MKLEVTKIPATYKFHLNDANVEVVKVANNNTYHRVMLKFGAMIYHTSLIEKLIDDISNTLSFEDIKVKVTIEKNILSIEYSNFTDSNYATLNAKVVDDTKGVNVYLENVINVITEDV